MTTKVTPPTEREVLDFAKKHGVYISIKTSWDGDRCTAFWCGTYNNHTMELVYFYPQDETSKSESMALAMNQLQQILAGTHWEQQLKDNTP